LHVFNDESDEVGNHYITKLTSDGQVTLFKPLVDNIKMAHNTNE